MARGFILIPNIKINFNLISNILQTIYDKDNTNWFGYFGPAWPKPKIVSTDRKL